MEQPNFNIDTQFVADTMTPVVNISPTQQMATEIRQKASQPDIYQSLSPQNGLFSQNSFAPEKRALKGFANETFDQAYAQLSSGEYVSKFQDFGFMPNTDNMERSANLQSTGDKWLNGIAKFGTKTLNAIAGGTIGTVNGAINGVKEGSLSAVYDNDFNRWLDDLNVKMDYKLPNYYTKQEQEAGFFGSLGSANFWANDVLGAASFTVGAFVSEGIWAYATGGASLATAGARWGLKSLGFTKATQGLNTYKGWMKEGIKNSFRTGAISKQTAINYSRVAEGLNTTRFLVTSAGYEAGVEALHFRKEAEENFYANFESINGRPPSQEDITEFQENITEASNGVFGLNMAILMPSNLAMFGSMFNIGSPFKAINKGVNKSLFGVGVEKTAEGTYKAIQATKFQKLAQKTFPILKSTTIEGLYEEGGQSVASKTMGKWLDSTYDPKQTANTFSMYDAMYDSMAETYGTKEGWKELGIGMIIGGAFGAKGNYSEMTNLKNRQTEIVSGENTFVSGKIAQSVMMTNQMQSAIERQKTAQEKGDRVGATIASNEVVMAQIAFKYKMGENLNDLVGEYQTALDGMTVEDFKNIGVEESQIQEYKDTVINSFAKVTNRYEQNREFANRLLGVNKGQWIGDRNANQELHAEALAHTLTVGETANEVMGDIVDEMGEFLSAEHISSLKTQQALQIVGQATKAEVRTLSTEVKNLEKQRDAYFETVRKIQNRPKTAGDVEGNRQQGDDYLDASEKLLEVETQLEQKRSALDKVTEDVRTEVQKRSAIRGLDLSADLTSSYISSDMILNLEKNLADLDKVIDSYGKSNPRVFEQLSQLSKDYQNSQEQFLNYQNSAIAMSSGNFKIKASNSWLSRILKSGATMDEFTKEFLGEVYEKYLDTMGMGAGRKQKADDAQTETTTEVTETQKVDNDKPVNRTAQEQVVTPISETQALKNRLEESLKNRMFPLNYMGENYSDLALKKPTQAEIDEYGDLFSRGGQINRTEAEQKRFEELNEKLGDWKLLDSAYDSETQSIADIIELIELLETQIEAEQTVDEIIPEDLNEITAEAFEAQSDMVVYEFTQNTLGNVIVKKLKNGRIRFSHLKPQSIINTLGGEVTITVGKNVIENPSEAQIEKYTKEGSIFSITPEGSTGAITFNIEAGNAISFKEEDFYANQQALNLYIVDTGVNWSYKDVYEWNGQDFTEKPSDFVGDNLNGDTYELSAQDEVEFYYDADDTYNQKLLKQFEKDGDKEALMSQLKIYTRKDGKNFSTLKSLRKSTADDNMMSIRTKAMEMAINGVSGVFGATKVEQVYLGTPKLNMDSDGRILENEFSQRAVEEVTTTGFIQDGVFTLANKTLEDKVEKIYVGKMSRTKTGRKIPVVVVKKGKYLVAYPISLKKTDAPKVAEMQTILSNPATNEVDKVKAINNLLISIGVSPSEFELTTLDGAKLEAIQTVLENYKTFQTADNIAEPTYKKEQLIQDATIQIDLENLPRSISSPKLRINLEDHIIYEDRAVKYESVSEVEESLSDMAIEVDRMLNPANGEASSYVDSRGDQIEDNFREVFDDNEIKRNPKNNLEHIANLNILRDAFGKLNKSAKSFLTPQKVTEIQNAFKKLDFLRNQVKTAPNATTKNNLQC
jgi:hypothetical protein